MKFLKNNFTSKNCANYCAKRSRQIFELFHATIFYPTIFLPIQSIPTHLDIFCQPNKVMPIFLMLFSTRCDDLGADLFPIKYNQPRLVVEIDVTPEQ